MELHTGRHGPMETRGTMFHRGSMGQGCVGKQERTHPHGGGSSHDVEFHEMNARVKQGKMGTGLFY